MLGAVQYFRPLIKDCAQICRPLTSLLAKDVPFEWTAAQEAAFVKTKEILSSDIVMSPPDPGEPMYVDTDAGPDGIGAVLYQIGEDGKRRAIWYLSRTLKPYELLYSTTEKELLAIVYAMDKLHSIIGIGANVVVSTDARNVVWLYERTANEGVSDFRVQNWLMRLQAVPNFTIRHVPAERNRMGDALSRAVRRINTPASRRDAVAAGGTSSPADDAERTDDVTLGLTGVRKRLYERARRIDEARDSIDLRSRDIASAGIPLRLQVPTRAPRTDCDPNYLDKEFVDDLPEPRHPNRIASHEPDVPVQPRSRVLAYYRGSAAMPTRIPSEPFGPAAGGAGGPTAGARRGAGEGGHGDDTDDDEPVAPRQLTGKWVAVKYGADGWYKGYVIQPHLSQRGKHHNYFGLYTVLVEGDRTPFLNSQLLEATEGTNWIITTPPSPEIVAEVMKNVAIFTKKQDDQDRAAKAKKDATEARKRHAAQTEAAGTTKPSAQKRGRGAPRTSSPGTAKPAERAKRVGRLRTKTDIERLVSFPSYAAIAAEQRAVWPGLWKAHWPGDASVAAAPYANGHSAQIVPMEVAQFDHSSQESDEHAAEGVRPATPRRRLVKILMYRHTDDGLHVPYMPPRYRRVAIEAAHAAPTSGHRGTQATVARLRRTAWWVEHARDVHLFVRTCLECDRLRPFGARQRPTTLAWSEVRPGATIHIDFVGPFHTARTGDKYILSIIDRFSRYCMFVPLPNQLHETAAKALVEKWFCLFGVPVRVISDNGTHFQGDGWRDIERHLWFKHVHTAAYAPWSNGAVERIHSTLKATLTKFCLNNNERWAEMLDRVSFAANTSVHTALGVSPHEVMFGWKPRMPFEGVYKSDLNEKKEIDPASYAAWHKMVINEAWTMYAGIDEERAQATQKASMPKHKVEQFTVGDMVWRRNPTPSNPERSLGPMRIEADVSRGTGSVYRVRDMRTGRATKRVHRADLRPYLLGGRPPGRVGAECDVHKMRRGRRSRRRRCPCVFPMPGGLAPSLCQRHVCLARRWRCEWRGRLEMP